MKASAPADEIEQLHLLWHRAVVVRPRGLRGPLRARVVKAVSSRDPGGRSGGSVFNCAPVPTASLGGPNVKAATRDVALVNPLGRAPDPSIGDHHLPPSMSQKEPFVQRCSSQVRRPVDKPYILWQKHMRR